jgi:hypothetical protein
MVPSRATITACGSSGRAGSVKRRRYQATPNTFGRVAGQKSGSDTGCHAAESDGSSALSLNTMSPWSSVRSASFALAPTASSAPNSVPRK